MMPERYHALQELLDCSLQMQRQAEAGEWLDVIETGARRQQLIDCFFERPVAAEESHDVEQVLRKMLQINEAIEELAVSSRGNAGNSIGAIQQGRRAVNAYAENT